MALVDPNIAMSYKGIQLADPLAQYGQVANIQNALLQREATQFNMERAREDYSLAKQLQQQLIAAGKSGDLNQLFDAMIASGNPDYVAKGVDYKQRLENVKRFEQMAGRMFPGLIPTAPTAPAAPEMPAAGAGAMPVQPPTSLTVTPLGEGGLPAPTVPAQGAMPAARWTGTALPADQLNALRASAGAGDMEARNMLRAYDAATAAAPAAAPAPGAGSISAMSTDQLRQAEILFSQSTDPRAKALTGIIQKEIESRKQPDLVKQYEYAKTPAGGGFTGSLAEWKRLSAAQQKVTVDAGETQESKEWRKMLVDEYKTIASRVEAGRKTLPALESSLAILDKGFDTGFGTEAKTAAAKVLGALGVEKAADYAADSQVFLANAAQAVLQRQLEQKGPQTEADAQRITQTAAQLGNTKEANRFLLKVAKAQIKRDVAQKEFYRNWQEQNKTLQGAEAAWEKGEGSKSLFDSTDLKEYASGTPAGPISRPPLDSIFKPQGR